MNYWLHSAHVSKQQPRQEPKYSNTSADVEKTPGKQAYILPSEKHLHGRGEDLSYGFLTGLALETPPRTWRRPLTGEDDVTLLGNTSTDVEKTRKRGTKRERGRKHLHGRGEDLKRFYLGRSDRETPPRTWRRQRPLIGLAFHFRNTSTDVEKTAVDFSQMPTDKETPPRTWRRHHHGRKSGCRPGNTSTDVEKTQFVRIL